MPVQCPLCQWPSFFTECGPVEDPTILLSGTAHIAQAPVQIVVIRTSTRSRRIPDYRSDVPRACYAEDGLDARLEQLLEDCEYLANEFGELLGGSGPGAVELATGRYILVALTSHAASRE